MLQTLLRKFSWQVEGQESKWNGDFLVEWEGKTCMFVNKKKGDFVDTGQPCFWLPNGGSNHMT